MTVVTVMTVSAAQPLLSSSSQNASLAAPPYHHERPHADLVGLRSVQPKWKACLMPRAWRAAKGCSPIGCNRRCATADNSLDCLLPLRSRFGNPRRRIVAYWTWQSCGLRDACAHGRRSICEACHWHPIADWTSLTVIARCTNVLTNAPSAPLLTCSILPCAWRSGVCSPTSARLLRVGLPALKARHRPGP